MQSKKHSLLETFLSVGIGFGVALLGQKIIFPIFDLQTSHSTDVQIALLFTVLSVIRAYWVRRFFNYLHIKGIL